MRLIPIPLFLSASSFQQHVCGLNRRWAAIATPEKPELEDLVNWPALLGHKMHLHFERNINTKCDCTILSLSWMGKVPDDIPEVSTVINCWPSRINLRLNKTLLSEIGATSFLVKLEDPLKTSATVHCILLDTLCWVSSKPSRKTSNTPHWI